LFCNSVHKTYPDQLTIKEFLYDNLISMIESEIWKKRND